MHEKKSVLKNYIKHEKNTKTHQKLSKWNSLDKSSHEIKKNITKIHEKVTVPCVCHTGIYSPLSISD